MRFQKYVKAVGTGPKSNRELTQAEVVDAINMILKQEIVPERITAFLLGWRVRLETNEELKATIETCDKYITKTLVPNSIELGYAYDGKNKTTYLFPLVAKYLKPFGINIVVSGDLVQPAKNGITTKMICENLILEDNIYYFDRSDYFKELSALTKLRNTLGLRSAFNTTEKLCGVGQSPYAITAAFHKPYVQKYHEIFGNLFENLVILKGGEGAPEFFEKCKYWEKVGDEINEYLIEPEKYGINYDKRFEKMTLEEALDEINNPSVDLQNLAKLNAAFYLVVAQQASTVDEAYKMIGEKC